MHCVLLAIYSMLAFGITRAFATEPNAQEGDSDEAIQFAVEDLNSPSFAIRERATRNLWGFGEQVRPLLAQLVETGNLEARQRAAQILADFEFGITPDVSPHIAKLLRQYRSGSIESRLQVITTLVSEGDLNPLKLLAKRSADQRTRHLIYSCSVESTPLMINLIERDELDAWIETMNNDNFRQPRHETVSRWLTSTGVLNALSVIGKLSLVDAAIDQERNEENRNRLLRRLFVQRTFTDFYSDAERIDTMLKYIETLSNRSERHDLFVRFLSLARNPTIYDPPSFSKLKRFASEQCTSKTVDEFWNYMVDAILQRPEVVSQLNDDRIRTLVVQLNEPQLERLRKTIHEHALHLEDLLDR